MDFFDIKFSKLFLERHGSKVFDEIRNKIKSESLENYNSKYEECVFKIAFFSFWGLDDDVIKKMIFDMEKIEDINIEDVKNVHKKSIAEIQSFIEDARKQE